MKKVLPIIVLLIFTSCLGTKKVINKEHSLKQTEKVSSKNDSISKTKTEINKEIKDKLIIDVGDSGSDDCNDKIDEILSKLNTSKSSGGNSYKSRYDKETRQLLVDFIVSQTESKQITTDTNSEFVSDKTFEETTKETVKRVIKIIPWWLWIIIAFILRKQIISLISIFFPAIKGIETISDLFTPPTKK